MQELGSYLSADAMVQLGKTQGVRLQGIVSMMKAIPEKCWGSSDDYAAFIEAESTVNATMRAWEAGRGVGGIPAVRHYNVPRLLDSLLQNMSDDPKEPPETAPGAAVNYISQKRLQQLRDLPKKSFDLAKLIRLCEELNSNWHAENWLSVGMLLRAILDHVPPIFSTTSFAQYAAVAGGQSLKASMSNLDNSSRRIADRFLHEQVARRAALPTDTQVWFAPELDVLLGEIVNKLSL